MISKWRDCVMQKDKEEDKKHKMNRESEREEKKKGTLSGDRGLRVMTGLSHKHDFCQPQGQGVYFFYILKFFLILSTVHQNEWIWLKAALGKMYYNIIYTNLITLNPDLRFQQRRAADVMHWKKSANNQFCFGWADTLHTPYIWYRQNNVHVESNVALHSILKDSHSLKNNF